MKTQLDNLLSDDYRVLLWRIKCRLTQFCGSQQQAAVQLGLDPANLSKILSGVIDCNSKLFFKMLHLAGLVVIANDPINQLLKSLEK